MAKKAFKTESKRILDLMINSIYTNKDIFLRELISNASDAIDKLYFRSLTDDAVGMARSDFAIDLQIDKAARTLTVRDNGIGMDKGELESNLGTIAKSGSSEFVSANDPSSEIDIIGQFGVGFYSAFMVAEKITVISQRFGEETAYKWVSSGADGYTVSEAQRGSAGTDIILTIRPDTEDVRYSDYLDCYRISELVKRYSDYIRYPIRLDMERGRKNADSDEYETYLENTVLNSMVPLWKKNRKEISDEEYNGFFRDKFACFEEPKAIIHQHAEGMLSYHALLCVPTKAEYNYYSKEFEKGLQLYSRGVLITDKCAELLPDCFSFIRGLVDSEDLSLNISREMLQQDRQLSAIRSALEKRIRKELSDLLKNRREDYEEFFREFGLQLKFSLYKSFGMERELLEDLLLFHSAEKDGYVTLKEYRETMPETQEKIFYAAGDDLAKLSSLPQAELVRSKGFDILFCTDDVDEFLFGVLGSFEEKEFRSIASGDLGLESDEEKNEKERLSKEHEKLFRFMTEALEGKVKEVRLSSRLVSHPVCLSADGPVSLEMEKVLGAMPGNGEKIKADRVLEINANHKIFETLCSLLPENTDKLSRYAKLLYHQALLIEGLPVEDPLEFACEICDLMTE